MDPAPPHVPSRVDDEFIWGRGACDTKGIIASMITAAERLLERGIRDFGLLFVVGEERNSAGAMYAAEHPRGSQFIINGEPTSNRLALGSKGALLCHQCAAKWPTRPIPNWATPPSTSCSTLSKRSAKSNSRSTKFSARYPQHRHASRRPRAQRHPRRSPRRTLHPPRGRLLRHQRGFGQGRWRPGRVEFRSRNPGASPHGGRRSADHRGRRPHRHPRVPRRLGPPALTRSRHHPRCPHPRRARPEKGVDRSRRNLPANGTRPTRQ